jgi:hypothetical protein
VRLRLRLRLRADRDVGSWGSEVGRYVLAVWHAGRGVLLGSSVVAVGGWVLDPGRTGLLWLGAVLVLVAGFVAWRDQVRAQERGEAELRGQLEQREEELQAEVEHLAGALAESESMRAGVRDDQRTLHVVGRVLPLLMQAERALERVTRTMPEQPEPTEEQVAAAQRAWVAEFERALPELRGCGGHVTARLKEEMFGPAPVREGWMVPSEANRVVLALIDLREQAVRRLAVE